MTKTTIRYSDPALAEFRAVLENKLAKSTAQLLSLREQMEDVNENSDYGYDPDDNSSSFVDLEFLQEMIYRQEKHIHDLENALVRIKNKTFGVCQVTGELIDKKRLMAVPTTTKSLAAKLNPIKPLREERPNLIKNAKPIVTTKILKPTPNLSQQVAIEPDDLDIDFTDDEDLTEGWEITPFDEEMEGLI